MIQIPEEFGLLVAGRPGWSDWLATVPRLAAELIERWQLRVDGPSWSGECAVVVPVRTDDGRPGALKVGWPHVEAEHEHLALREWHGNGAVQLWRADPPRFALLLERADAGRDLGDEPVVEACEVVAGLYGRLHRPAIPQLRRLSELCAGWAEQLPELVTTGLAPRRFVEQATGLARDFAADPGTDGRLIHADLHYANVLAASREPWLVIDPKPLSGDPAYEVAPLLWNRWAEALAAPSVRSAVLERFYTVVDVAGLDEDRTRDWVVVRELVNVLDTYRDQRDRGLPMSAEWVTRCTTVAKAVQR